MTRKVTAGCFRKRLLLLPYATSCVHLTTYHPQYSPTADERFSVLNCTNILTQIAPSNKNTKTRHIIPIPITFVLVEKVMTTRSIHSG